MAIMPNELDNPESGALPLDNREVRSSRRRLAPIRPAGVPAPPSAEELLAALRERIAKARKLGPAPDGLHCRDCFGRGRDAALDFIEGR